MTGPNVLTAQMRNVNARYAHCARLVTRFPRNRILTSDIAIAVTTTIQNQNRGPKLFRNRHFDSGSDDLRLLIVITQVTCRLKVKSYEIDFRNHILK